MAVFVEVPAWCSFLRVVRIFEQPSVAAMVQSDRPRRDRQHCHIQDRSDYAGATSFLRLLLCMCFVTLY